MRIWLVDEGTLAKDRLDGATLLQIANALTVQANSHFGPMWESWGATVGVGTSVASLPPDDCVIIISDSAAEPDALGDHETGGGGRPTGRIFLAPILENGGGIIDGDFSLSSVISHEVLEMLGDPYATWWADGNDGKEYALEVCDPVEGDTYAIDGVQVSNFVGPRYFSSGPGPYDFLRKLTAPYAMTPGGYLIVRDPGGRATQVFGDGFPAWRKPLKRKRLAA